MTDIAFAPATRLASLVRRKKIGVPRAARALRGAALKNTIPPSTQSSSPTCQGARKRAAPPIARWRKASRGGRFTACR